MIPPVVEAELSAGKCELCQGTGDELVVIRRSGWQAAGPELRAGLGTVLVEALTGMERLLGRDTPYMLWIHQRPADGNHWPAAAEFGAGTWFAPGRVNLIGGPDYTEVFVLPVTLGAGVCAAASRRADGRIALVSRQAGGEPVAASIDTLEPGSAGGWAAYPAGVAWALREAGYLPGGADMAIDADLPAGAGLSSSAALECAAALALTGLYQVPVPRRELAALARRAENVFAGVPTGIMDQIATLLVIDTRVRRALADGRYAERRRACEQGASALGVRSLRDVTDDRELARLDEPSLRRVCGHVLAEKRRVLRAAELLRAGGREQLTATGGLLTVSHYSLRDQFGVSWPQADEAVAAATEAGAAGARMTGGGFGGCVVALVPADRTEQVRGAVTERFARHHWPAPCYLDGVPSDGGRRLR
jgi:galactokinase